MNSSLSIRNMRCAAIVLALAIVAQPAFSMTASEVFEIASKSTVVIKKLDAKGKTIGLGSGVVLPGGDIATNCHVIEGASSISVRSYGNDYPATLRYSDWERDVCSVSSAGNKQNTPVTMGSTKGLKIGKPVYAIGSPQGLELTLSDGIVSSLREVEGGNYIQTTAAISPGSSGGGLFDENGALVGLTAFYLAEGQNLNFAVPAEWVTELPKRHSSENVKSPPATKWLNKAIELDSQKALAALIDHCLLWTRSQPQLALAWYFLGIAYGKSGETKKAIESYQQAIRIKPKYEYAWNNLGNVYNGSGQSAKAIESYLQAIRISPEYADAWNNLGAAYYSSGQTTKAIESCQQAIRINSEHAGAWYNLGIAYGKSGQTAKAIESYQQAIRINPENAATWYNLGTIFGYTGQTAKAIQSFLQAIRINPEDADSWYYLGEIYTDSGQTEKAIDSYQQAIRINPEYATAWYNLGVAYGKTGDTSKAIYSLQKVIQINPEDANAWYSIGICYRISEQSNTYKAPVCQGQKYAQTILNRFF